MNIKEHYKVGFEKTNREDKLELVATHKVTKLRLVLGQLYKSRLTWSDGKVGKLANRGRNVWNFSWNNKDVEELVGRPVKISNIARMANANTELVGLSDGYCKPSVIGKIEQLEALFLGK